MLYEVKINVHVISQFIVVYWFKLRESASTRFRGAGESGTVLVLVLMSFIDFK